MNCPKCGDENISGVSICSNCGALMETVNTEAQKETTEESTQSTQVNENIPPEPPGNEPSVNSNPLNGGIVSPKSYMVESVIMTIVSLLCCCSPISAILGIIAIVKAGKVNSEFNAGNLNEAAQVSESTKKLLIIALAIFVLFSILNVVLSYYMRDTLIEFYGLEEYM